MNIIIDTREKQIYHITKFLSETKFKYFGSDKINYCFQKLDSGDYSFILDGKDFSKIITIERKASLDELANNFTWHRDRFKREFERAKENNTKVILLIEDSYENIIKHNYRSKFHPNAFLGSLKSWKEKELISDIYFGSKKNTGKFIIDYFKNYCINYVEKNNLVLQKNKEPI